MLTFYEEIMVLLLHDENGTFLPVSEHTLNRALTGAVLMDLAFANRIDTDPERLVVIDSAPTGDALLDRTLARIAGESASADSRTWDRDAVGRGSIGGAERHDPLDRARQAGGTRRAGAPGREVPVGLPLPAGIPPSTARSSRRRRSASPTCCSRTRSRTPGTWPLICLVDSCSILPTIFSKREIDRVDTRNRAAPEDGPDRPRNGRRHRRHRAGHRHRGGAHRSSHLIETFVWTDEAPPPRHGRACPGHPRVRPLRRTRRETWMPATSAGMTNRGGRSAEAAQSTRSKANFRIRT